MTPDQIATAVLAGRFPEMSLHSFVYRNMHTAVVDGIERALAERAAASAPLRAEIADAVDDYHRVFPPPADLAPNLALAARAAAILSGHDRPDEWFTATTEKGDTVHLHKPSYDTGWHDHDEEFLAGELNG